MSFRLDTIYFIEGYRNAGICVENIEMKVFSLKGNDFAESFAP